MDAIEKLLAEHVSHRKLMDDIEMDRSLYSTLRDEFVHHVNMEEAVFYPNLLRVPELEAIVREAWEEHSLCMQLLQEMDELELDSKMWESKYAVFKKLALTHLDEEETNLFPRVREMASKEFLLEVGKQMMIQKASTSTEEILYPEVEGSHKLQD